MWCRLFLPPSKGEEAWTCRRATRDSTSAIAGVSAINETPIRQTDTTLGRRDAGTAFSARKLEFDNRLRVLQEALWTDDKSTMRLRSATYRTRCVAAVMTRVSDSTEIVTDAEIVIVPVDFVVSTVSRGRDG